MRCLTLADALRGKGVESHFICRAFSGHLGDKILKAGYKLHLLPYLSEEHLCSKPQTGNVPEHEEWLGVGWQTDLAETRDILAEHQCDWLIVDHYALDHRWERGIRSCVKKIMVIDDLADREHDCDLLLDQTPGRDKKDYVEKVPFHSKLLIGPKYALLKPEFARLRTASLERRFCSDVQRILISMGGIDQDNVTGKILAEMDGKSFCENIQVTVILGPTASNIEVVKKQAETLSFKTKVLVGVSNMADLMFANDLAIGAAGGTSLERCCLGLPCLIMILADNQKQGAQALAKEGAAVVLGEVDSINNLSLVLESLIKKPKWVNNISNKASLLTEGKGLTAVIKWLALN